MNFDQMEKNRDNIYDFFGSLVGEGYKEKILEKYPNTVWTFLGDDELPEIKQTQAWCCNCGCGEKDPVLVPCLNYSVCSDQEEGDGLLEGHVSGNWQSPCISHRGDDSFEHWGMFLWDYQTDEDARPPVTLEGRW